MAETTFIPVIISAVLTPNPAIAGGRVLILVAAADIEAVPAPMEWISGAWGSNPA